jgi:hypothetical protein
MVYGKNFRGVILKALNLKNYRRDRKQAKPAYQAPVRAPRHTFGVGGRGVLPPPMTELWQTIQCQLYVKRLSACMLNVCQSSILSLLLSSLLYLYVNRATFMYTAINIGDHTITFVILSFILYVLANFLASLIHLISIKVSPFKAKLN